MLYINEGKLYATEYTEIYIPVSYIQSGLAINRGAMMETFGILYIQSFVDGQSSGIKLFKIPTIINISIYDMIEESIKINGKNMNVITLKYLKDTYVMHRTIQQGREVAEAFLNSILMGKLPNTLNYADIIDIWWKNIEIAGIDYKVPSKIFELVIASIYRNKSNFKQRYGQYYGLSNKSDGYDYVTGNVRDIVENLSTFSGMIFEDINRMITTGINTSMNGEEELISPLEKVIYY